MACWAEAEKSTVNVQRQKITVVCGLWTINHSVGYGVKNYISNG